MITIYERITDFILSKLKGKTLEYLIIMTLLCGIFYIQYHYLSEMIREKQYHIEQLILEFEKNRVEKERYMQAYIDCEKSSNIHVKERLENIERMLQRQ